MRDKAETWWVLGFPLESLVDDWPDARLALALEQLWTAARRPDDVEALWAPAADRYVCRWYLNAAAAGLLDRARVAWRRYIVDQIAAPPADARPLLARVLAS